MTKSTRRRFLAQGLAGLGLAACSHHFGRGDFGADDARFEALGCKAPGADPGDGAFDFVIVGSGAGGGPLAANLARAGWRVALIEAGGDDGGANYAVPVFHAFASEDRAMRWDYFVRHYVDPARAERDPKYVASKGGILYPRAGTLGGCTAHHAMVTIYPHNSDWEAIAELVGDPSWGPEVMRGYFERLERCNYVTRPSGHGEHANPSRHGHDGWLPTTMSDPKLALRDLQFIKVLAAAIDAAVADKILPSAWKFLDAQSRDPNDWRAVTSRGEGVFGVPISTHEGRRAGTREYLEATAAQCPGTLTIFTHTLANRITLDDELRAVGVECQRGKHLYRADPEARDASGQPFFVRARREVILAAGAFNSPQLLMLSGIGPRSQLEPNAIPVRLERHGVGANLQDRYEISVVSQMRQEFALVNSCRFEPPGPNEAADPCFAEWRAKRRGVYATNGVACAIIKRSRPELPDPDLFMFGVPGLFRGYHPGYSHDLADAKDHLSWVVLKGHTRNTAGRVTLRSPDPRDPPQVDFRYFDPEDPTAAADRDAVVTGLEFVRDILRRGGSEIVRETLPGPEVATREDLARYVENQAWGHHASCTNKMGPASDPLAVVDGDFRVHGTRGLRIVDASVFPRIPGFFIVSAIYMISEKATDRILAEHGRGPGAG